MKRLFGRTAVILVTLFAWIAAAAPLGAQTSDDDVITISGIVRDEVQRLPYVSVTIQGSTLGTVTNEDGYFTLKIPATESNITLVVSHVGYYASTLTVKATQAHDLTFTLKSHPNLLDQATIISYDPETLVRAAVSRIRANYPASPVLHRGFYRETAQKGSRYISISEAVLDLYKSSYARDIDNDRVRVIKGRRLVSQKPSDTLSVKLQGGPTLGVKMDVMKNRFDLFFERDLAAYDYAFEQSTVIEQRPQFVVSMTPRVPGEEYPYYKAHVYIDKQTLAVMRVEYSVDMSDVDKVTGMLLKKKPANMKFQPLDVAYVVGYRTIGDVTVLNYVRAEIRFKCDWKRKLFSSTYSVVSEMVSTDIRQEGAEQIQFRDSFKESEIFYDKVSNFSDPDFWGAYNILEPSESLEHAVGRLKRRAR